jgi:hypothetical protein
MGQNEKGPSQNEENREGDTCMFERLIEVLPKAFGERLLGRRGLGAAQRSLAVLDDGVWI